MTLRITGASDDLVEVDGDVREEFSYRHHDGDGTLLALSTGHVFRIKFGDGWWMRLEAGPEDGPDPALKFARDELDDTVTVQLDVTWVVCDDRIEFAPDATPDSPRAGLRP